MVEDSGDFDVILGFSMVLICVLMLLLDPVNGCPIRTSYDNDKMSGEQSRNQHLVDNFEYEHITHDRVVRERILVSLSGTRHHPIPNHHVSNVPIFFELSECEVGFDLEHFNI